MIFIELSCPHPILPANWCGDDHAQSKKSKKSEKFFENRSNPIHKKTGARERSGYLLVLRGVPALVFACTHQHISTPGVLRKIHNTSVQHYISIKENVYDIY